MPKRDFINEIVERRSRLPQVRAMSLLLVRLSDLEQEFERRDELSDELMRYFPVAIVACLEGFFRELIRELVDHGPPYSDNLDKFDDSRIDMKALKAIHGRQITVGEFIAHQVSLSSFESLVSVMERLLGDDFLEKLKGIRSAWSLHLFGEETTPPMLGDAPVAFEGVKEAFRLRHILAHELATAYPITRAAVEGAFSATSAFIYAADELVSRLLYPDEQGSQSHMTQAAIRRYEEAEKELQSVLEKVQRHLPSDKASAFIAAQAAWQDMREQTAHLHADLIAEGGTMWPQMYYGMLGAITRHRADELGFLGGGFYPLLQHASS